MLFRSRGWLCTVTIHRALGQPAGDQTGATSPTPSAAPPGSEAGSWKIDEPIAKQAPQPNATSMNPEQEAGWSGEIVEPVLQNRRHEQLLQVPAGHGLRFIVRCHRYSGQNAIRHDECGIIAVSTRGIIICFWNRNIPSKFSLTTKSLSESASSSCQRESTLLNQGLSA